MDELRVLGTLLVRVGSASAALHQSTATELRALDASLAQLADTVRNGALSSRPASGPATAFAQGQSENLLRLRAEQPKTQLSVPVTAVVSALVLVTAIILLAR
jgi:hypothetical protein